MAEIKKLLDYAIETEINNLNSASNKDEKSEVIKNLAALHKLRIEEIKTETEIEEKSERRAMDKAAHDEDATLKAFQLDENTLDRYAKIGIAAAELVLPLMFYGVWMRRGLRFEETGTFTSQTFKNLFNRFKPKVTGLTTKVNDLVTAGGEPNKLEGIKVNGTLLALADKIADILIAEGKTNGTISANGVDIPVHGLAALAYKSEVAESDLAAALKAIIDAKAKQADLDTLTGNGEGSISKMIDKAINKFATDVTDDNVVNSYKELIDWVAKHGPEATKMAGGISENKTAIADLKTLVGTLPEGATSTTVVAYITEAINALSIGDYAKTTEVTAAINTALESYYTKTQVDETFVKKTDIVMATDEEVDAMLTEVFGAQATV